MTCTHLPIDVRTLAYIMTLQYHKLGQDHEQSFWRDDHEIPNKKDF